MTSALELERTSDEKHECLRGAVWAMAGGTPSHGKMAANATGALIAARRLQLGLAETDRSTYPDVTVISPATRTPSSSRRSPARCCPTRPSAGKKFALQESVLVNQREPRVEVFRRGQGTTWTLIPHTSGRVALTSVDATLDRADLSADPTA